MRRLAWCDMENGSAWVGNEMDPFAKDSSRIVVWPRWFYMLSADMEAHGHFMGCLCRAVLASHGLARKPRKNISATNQNHYRENFDG